MRHVVLLIFDIHFTVHWRCCCRFCLLSEFVSWLGEFLLASIDHTCIRSSLSMDGMEAHLMILNELDEHDSLVFEILSLTVEINHVSVFIRFYRPKQKHDTTKSVHASLNITVWVKCRPRLTRIGHTYTHSKAKWQWLFMHERGKKNCSPNYVLR